MKEPCLLRSCWMQITIHLMSDTQFVRGGTNEDWLWFLTILHEFLGGLKSDIMSDKNQGLLLVVAYIFGAKNHIYCVTHLKENLLTEAAKLGIRYNASNDLLNKCSIMWLLQRLQQSMMVQ